MLGERSSQLAWAQTLAEATLKTTKQISLEAEVRWLRARTERHRSSPASASPSWPAMPTHCSSTQLRSGAHGSPCSSSKQLLAVIPRHPPSHSSRLPMGHPALVLPPAPAPALWHQAAPMESLAKPSL